MAQPIQIGADIIDLGKRFVHSSTVVGSPAAGSITQIATITIPTGLTVVNGVYLIGWAAFTAGTNAVSALLGIRQTSTSGSLIASTGAETVVATDLYDENVHGLDASPPAAGVYVLCLTMGSGSATSTVSAVSFAAFVI